MEGLFLFFLLEDWLLDGLELGDLLATSNGKAPCLLLKIGILFSSFQVQLLVGYILQAQGLTRFSSLQLQKIQGLFLPNLLATRKHLSLYPSSRFILPLFLSHLLHEKSLLHIFIRLCIKTFYSLAFFLRGLGIVFKL